LEDIKLFICSDLQIEKSLKTVRQLLWGAKTSAAIDVVVWKLLFFSFFFPGDEELCSKGSSCRLGGFTPTLFQYCKSWSTCWSIFIRILNELSESN